MQYFRLKLECGHEFETVAVDKVDGLPYEPNYIGKEMPYCNQQCEDSHVAVELLKKWNR